MSKGKRRRRISVQEAEAGKLLAVTLHREDRLAYGDRKRRIVETIGCSESVAEKWMAAAIITALEDDSEIIPGDPTASRWKRVQAMDVRARRWRRNADRRVDSKKFGDAYRCETLAVQYEGLIAKLCHWDKLAPEQDLDDPRLRQTVIGIMTRKLAVFTTAELLDMYRGTHAELAERQRRPAIGQLNMVVLEARAREEQEAIDAIGVSVGSPTGETLADKI